MERIKLKNSALKGCLEALTAITTGGNRMPTVAGLRADRSRRALEAAWVPCEELRQSLIKEHGQKKEAKPACRKCGRGAEEGGNHVLPGMKGWTGFVKAFNEALAEEREYELETISFADIEAGYHRDPETKKKVSGLDVDSALLGELVVAGIVTGFEEKEKKEKPKLPAGRAKKAPAKVEDPPAPVANGNGRKPAARVKTRARSGGGPGRRRPVGA